MRRTARTVLLALGFACLLVGCSSDSANVEPSPTTAAHGATTETLPEPGPSTLITTDSSDLVAVDLATGDVTVLADRSELATSLGMSELDGRFYEVDLSHDGTTVAFTFGSQEGAVATDGSASAGGLYEVPADASAPATRIGEMAYAPRYSPDGRFLAVSNGSHLVVLDEQRVPTGEGVPIPAYPPRALTWSPDGASLVWVPHFERSACCPLARVGVDPSTGRLTGEPSAETSTGLPYYDTEGNLGAVPVEFQFDVDSTGRYIVASDGTPDTVVWWDTTKPGAPVPLTLDIALAGPPVPLAW